MIEGGHALGDLRTIAAQGGSRNYNHVLAEIKLTNSRFTEQLILRAEQLETRSFLPRKPIHRWKAGALSFPTVYGSAMLRAKGEDRDPPAQRTAVFSAENLRPARSTQRHPACAQSSCRTSRGAPAFLWGPVKSAQRQVWAVCVRRAHTSAILFSFQTDRFFGHLRLAAATHGESTTSHAHHH